MRTRKTAGDNRLIAAMPPRITSRCRRPPYAVAHASAAVLIAAAGSAYALPQNGVIVGGTATVASTANSTTITQTSQKASINWQSFDIGAGQTVTFNQPAATAVVLNRVIGLDPTTIAGALNANGQVFVVNPAGIVFGSGAAVNVGGLVASSRPISDLDFFSDTYRFNGSGGGVVRNEAGSTLQANTSGYIALIGPQVTNAGTIVTPSGAALLAGANDTTLTLRNGRLLGYTINAGVASALAKNASTGSISADGGRIVLTAKGLDAAAPAVVNSEGVLQAQTIGGTAGNIMLLATSDAATANAASVIVGSASTGGAKLDVSAPNTGEGGSIVLSGPAVKVIDPTAIGQVAPVITALGSGGSAGTVRIVQTAPDASFAIGGAGSNISGSTLNSTLNSAAVTIASAKDVSVNAALNWTAANNLNLYAATDVNVNAAVSNSGGASLLLRADSAGTGTGTINFTGPGSVSMSGGGRTDLYYNPTSYAAPTDYSSRITGGPYTAWMLVNNLQNLRDVSGNLAGSYALGRDIDASATSAAPFSPLGSFTGSFDGLDHVISNLKIATSGDAGLFIENRGRIANLGLEAADITATNGHAGALVASNYGVLVKTFSTGFVRQSGDTFPNAQQAGGLVARNYGAIINSWSGATVSSAFFAGGLVGGQEMGGSISESYATGQVSASTWAGGLVGYLGAGTIIRNSYSTASVSATVAGGLVANNSGGIIRDSYANANVSSTANSSWAGSLVGASDGGAITNSFGRDDHSLVGYFDAPTTISGSGTLSPAAMKQSSSFPSFSTKIWRQYDGYTTPLLKAFLKPVSIKVVGGEKVYDGTAWSGPLNALYSDPSAATSSGLHLDIQPPATPATNVGSYAVQYALWSDQRNGWDIQGATGALQSTTLDILARPVTTTGTTVATRTYDGTTVAPVQAGALQGLVSGETLGVTMTGAYADRNAGSAKSVSLSPVLLSDDSGAASNYVYYASEAPLVGTISPKTVSVSAVSDIKVYDGTRQSTAPVSFDIGQLVAGDTVIASGQTYASRNAGNGIVLSPTLTLSDGNGGANYTIATTDAQGAITPRPLSLAAVSDTKTYDGTTTSAIAPQLSSPLFGTDTVRRTQRFDSSDVGSRRLIPSYVIDDGNGGANYSVSLTDAPGSITPAYAGSGGASVVDTVLFNQGTPTPVAIQAALLTDPASRMPSAIDAASGTALALALNDDPEGESGSDAEDKARIKATARGRNTGYRFDVKQGGMRLPEGME